MSTLSWSGLLLAVAVIVILALLEHAVLPRLIRISRETTPAAPADSLIGTAFWIWVGLVASTMALAVLMVPRRGNAHDETLCLIGYVTGALLWLTGAFSRQRGAEVRAAAAETRFGLALGLIIGGIVMIIVRPSLQ